jgi:phage gp36-like protein
MSNYVSQAKLEERITSEKLAALCKVTGTAKSSLLEGVILRAEGLIDAYAMKRYKVPLPQNTLTEEWALVIAEYELYKRGSGAEMPVKIKDSYNNVLVLLKDLSAGKLNVPSAIEAEMAKPNTSLSLKSSRAMMSEDEMKGF